MRKKLRFSLSLCIFLSFFGKKCSAQELHHQMISAQGATKVTSSGIIVKQTIGQQSVSGTSSGSVVVQQGFQQNFWSKFLAESQWSGITVIPFPNPYTTIINFQFSTVINSSIDVSIFDIQGRMVHSGSEKVAGNLLTLNLERFPTAEYLVKLSSTQFYYYTKIIKK